MDNPQIFDIYLKMPKKYRIIIGLSFLLIVFSFIYNQALDKKVSLFNDNVHYYLLGKALAEGEGYTNIYNFEESFHQHFPPGYTAIYILINEFVDREERSRIVSFIKNNFEQFKLISSGTKRSSFLYKINMVSGSSHD